MPASPTAAKVAIRRNQSIATKGASPWHSSFLRVCRSPAKPDGHSECAKGRLLRRRSIGSIGLWHWLRSDSELEAEFRQSCGQLGWHAGETPDLARARQPRGAQGDGNAFSSRFYAERHGILGPDLAAASFLVFRGAAVKFHGKDDWYRKAEDGSIGLPQSYEDGWRVEAVDASEVELLYEGLDNLTNLEGLKALRLCGCPFVDDWFLDRLSQFKDSLEQLDLSGCPQITHRGLSALYRLRQVGNSQGQFGGKPDLALFARNLKTLTLRYLSHVEHLQLVALMLEDAIPGLEVKGVDFSVPPPSTDDREAQADGLDVGTRS
ncbi:hypothetical protein HPB47_009531 [Ixodes persulcatus]|uniref:Uncharacterized protein n=1 Tax=Ixodes persulcatus TaxID=34615 RepID=A0AC60P1W8_IXOPE|nr:hypothetical protein HPB47_009531 [Ixodes persulcatus]